MDGYPVLKCIDSPKDLKRLNMDELKQLAQEIRQFLLEKVSRTGGHLASNLGVVELTIALHYVFDSPFDKIIWMWDTRHMCIRYLRGEESSSILCANSGA